MRWSFGEWKHNEGLGTKAQRGVGTKLPREGFIRVTQWGVGTEPRQRKGLERECETEEELGRGHEKEEGCEQWIWELGYDLGICPSFFTYQQFLIQLRNYRNVINLV